MIKNFFGPSFTWTFWKDLYKEINEDNISNGAAALSYYLLFALFPALIFLLSLLPFLPIQNLHEQVMSFFVQILPGDAAKMIESTVAEVTLQKHGSALSFGAILTLWAASAGLYAIMQELCITYDVRDTRPFWKARGISVLLTLAFGAMVIAAFATIVFGGNLQDWFSINYGFGAFAEVAFAVFRYAVMLVLLFGSLALIYYFGPDVEQDFRFISPGAFFGVVILVAASFAFRYYVEQFGNYSASYGSLGAVIVLMLWLYIAGTVILLGSEINAMIEHYSPEGKKKGEKFAGQGVNKDTVDPKSIPNSPPAPGRTPAHNLR
jgi:membrane protein